MLGLLRPKTVPGPWWNGSFRLLWPFPKFYIPFLPSKCNLAWLLFASHMFHFNKFPSIPPPPGNLTHFTLAWALFCCYQPSCVVSQQSWFWASFFLFHKLSYFIPLGEVIGIEASGADGSVPKFAESVEVLVAFAVFFAAFDFEFAVSCYICINDIILVISYAECL